MATRKAIRTKAKIKRANTKKARVAATNDMRASTSERLQVGTFRMSADTRLHLKNYAERVNLTQGELLRRFVARLPKANAPLVQHVKVLVVPVV